MPADLTRSGIPAALPGECAQPGVAYPWRTADAVMLQDTANTITGPPPQGKHRTISRNFFKTTMIVRCLRHAPPGTPPVPLFASQVFPCGWVEPRRIQRHRTRGWRCPAGAEIVTRPTLWGNPFIVGAPWCPDAETAVMLYRTWVELGTLPPGFHIDRYPKGITSMKQWRDTVLADAPSALSGRVLVCWCAEDASWCHADPLIELANRHILGRTP